MEEQRRWFDVKAAADYLAVRPHTIRDAVWNGWLSYSKLGKKFVFDRADLDRLAESRKQRELVQ